MKPRKKGRGRRRNGPMRDILTANVYSAWRDESYTLIARLVDETLKNPKVREKIEYHTREIMKVIAENL